ncbi:MAG: GIY-YIG nuclease family protein [Patescibacteria group bacterium]|nr:GIY-YIG nuclease family protein [Patescibacteria group bacterium]
MYFVYILRCQDDCLYTGITWNLAKRIKEHNLGLTPFTKNKLPVKLVYVESFGIRQQAHSREKEIKGWRREKKENLIKEFSLR